MEDSDEPQADEEDDEDDEDADADDEDDETDSVRCRTVPDFSGGPGVPPGASLVTSGADGTGESSANLTRLGAGDSDLSGV